MSRKENYQSKINKFLEDAERNISDFELKISGYCIIIERKSPSNEFIYKYNLYGDAYWSESSLDDGVKLNSEEYKRVVQITGDDYPSDSD